MIVIFNLLYIHYKSGAKIQKINWIYNNTSKKIKLYI